MSKPINNILETLTFKSNNNMRQFWQIRSRIKWYFTFLLEIKNLVMYNLYSVAIAKGELCQGRQTVCKTAGRRPYKDIIPQAYVTFTILLNAILIIKHFLFSSYFTPPIKLRITIQTHRLI